MVLKFLKRVAKKIARRTRAKGSVRREMERPNRNFQGMTAADLWARTFRFRETPAARAGTRRRVAREKAFNRPLKRP